MAFDVKSLSSGFITLKTFRYIINRLYTSSTQKRGQKKFFSQFQNSLPTCCHSNRQVIHDAQTFHLICLQFKRKSEAITISKIFPSHPIKFLSSRNKFLLKTISVKQWHENLITFNVRGLIFVGPSFAS